MNTENIETMRAEEVLLALLTRPGSKLVRHTKPGQFEPYTWHTIEPSGEKIRGLWHIKRLINRGLLKLLDGSDREFVISDAGRSRLDELAKAVRDDQVKKEAKLQAKVAKLPNPRGGRKPSTVVLTLNLPRHAAKALEDLLYDHLCVAEDNLATTSDWSYPTGVHFGDYIEQLEKAIYFNRIREPLTQVFQDLRDAQGYVKARPIGLGHCWIWEYSHDLRKAFVAWVDSLFQAYFFPPDMECERTEKEQVAAGLEKVTRLGGPKGSGAVQTKDGWTWQGEGYKTWKELASAMVASFDDDPESWKFEATRQRMRSIRE